MTLSVFLSFFYCLFCIIIIIISYPLTSRVVGAPQMISQPVSSIFPILHCPLGLGELQACPFPNVVYSSVCLVFFSLSMTEKVRKKIPIYSLTSKASICADYVNSPFKARRMYLMLVLTTDCMCMCVCVCVCARPRAFGCACVGACMRAHVSLGRALSNLETRNILDRLRPLTPFGSNLCSRFLWQHVSNDVYLFRFDPLCPLDREHN